MFDDRLESPAAGGGASWTQPDALLAQIADERPWRREAALDRLRTYEIPDGLHASLVDALRDGGRPERRNAARSALAALASPDAAATVATLRLLERLCRDESDVDVRVLAASALGESGNPRARTTLEEALSDEDVNVAAAAADALGVLDDPRAVDALAATVSGGEFWLQVAAVVALGRLRDERAVPALAQAVQIPVLAEAAATALGEIGAMSGMEPLQALLQRPHPEDGTVRAVAQYAAARILGANPDLQPPAWLRESLRGSEETLYQDLKRTGDECAARLLGVAGTRTAAEHLLRELTREEHRAAASVGLAALPHPVATETILQRLGNAAPMERVALLAALPPLADERSVRRVAPFLAASEDEVRAAAAEALGRSEESSVLSVLEQVVEQPGSRLGAAQAMSRLGSARCSPLGDLLQDPDPRVRAAAATGLARCGAPEGERIRTALRAETDARARRALVRALGSMEGAAAVDELVPLLASEDVTLRFSVVRALGETGAPDAFPALVDALADPLPEIQAAALQALGDLGDARASEPIAEQFKNQDRDLRRTAALALYRLAPADAVNRLVAALADTDREVRLAGIRTLARLEGEAPRSALQRSAADDPDPLVRRTAAEALAQREDG